jgi:hypothetical protein
MSNALLNTTKLFAKLMDNCRFDEAARLLAPDCEYHFRDETFQGPKEIMASYSTNFEDARRKLDEIIFSSEVEPINTETYRILYLDRIRKGNHWFEHRSAQVITFKDGLIDFIQHQDLKGETELLQRFYQRAGIHST